MGELNRAICEDQKNLGPGFAVGHSFFCHPPQVGLDSPDGWRQWHAEIIDREIAPLLREYWFDDPDHAEQQIRACTLHDHCQKPLLLLLYAWDSSSRIGWQPSIRNPRRTS